MPFDCPHPRCERQTTYNLGGCLEHLLALPLPIRDDLTRARLSLRGTWAEAMARALAFWEGGATS